MSCLKLVIHIVVTLFWSSSQWYQSNTIINSRMPTNLAIHTRMPIKSAHLVIHIRISSQSKPTIHITTLIKFDHYTRTPIKSNLVIHTRMSIKFSHPHKNVNSVIHIKMLIKSDHPCKDVDQIWPSIQDANQIWSSTQRS